MPDLTQDIQPLTNFKRNSGEMLRQMKATHRPIILTVNGRAELVVQDAQGYQEMLDRLSRLEAVEAIRIGLDAVEQGRVKPARQALEELRDKLGISR